LPATGKSSSSSSKAKKSGDGASPNRGGKVTKSTKGSKRVTVGGPFTFPHLAAPAREADIFDNLP
jgi:hypothetical protein